MSQPTALIIEDNLDIAHIFEIALRHENYATEVICCGNQALERLQTGPCPQILVTDLHLPGRTGEVILQEMQEKLRAHGTKIILVTADGQGMQLEHLADLVLMKPVLPTQLRDLSNRLLKQHLH